jgi:hypothetical protein
MGKLLNEINQAYINFEKTKEEKYKKEWYALVKKFDEYINTKNNSES